MQPRLALLAALCLGSAAVAAEPVVLQLLAATSGPGAELLFDGDPSTGWNPGLGAREEGVLLRFEQPVTIDGVSLRSCQGFERFQTVIYLDGALVAEASSLTDASPAVSFPRARPRSLFVRVLTDGGRDTCLGELSLSLQGVPVAVAPPRQVVGRVTASSTLAPEDAFHPSFLFDSRLDFGWAEADVGPGTGQSITLTLEAPVELVALDLWNGHQRSDDHFRKNARARSLAVSVDGGPAVTLPVKDASGRQRLALPRPLKGRTWTVLVQDVYPGKSYQDLVLGELRLVDAQGPLGVRTPDDATRQQALRARLASSPLGLLVDQSWSAVCSLEHGSKTSRTMKLRTHGSFVFYTETMDHDWPARTEVFEGAWVPKKVEGPWASVELFGRRQGIDTNWMPEGRARKQEPVSTAGGTLEMARVESLSLAEYQKLVSSWSQGAQREGVNCLKADAKGYQNLIARKAFFVRGKAFMDVFESH